MTVTGNCSLSRLVSAMQRKRWMSVCAVVLAMPASLLSQAAPGKTQRPNRITQSVYSGRTINVTGTAHPLTQGAADLGAVTPEMQMESLTLNTNLGAAGQTELNALLEAQQDPKSPQYHRWLTQEEYGARFGLTDADLNAVTGWLKRQGFTVKSVSRSRNAIHFSGQAGQVDSAFQTQLRAYELDGERHFANATELRLPVEIAGVVQNVRGLDNFRPKANIHQIAVTPDYTYSSTVHFLTPMDWATIYDLNPMYNAGYDGTGIYLGVVGQTYAPLTDIEGFTQNVGTGTPNLTYVCISTADCTSAAGISQSDWTEADVDIEWAGGIARRATVDYVYAAGDDQTQGVFDALQYAIQSYKSASGLVLPVISMSYTACEIELPLAQAKLFDAMGKQASAQGQTLVVASGDSGAAGCDAHSSSSVLTAVNGISAEAPADSPNFTTVGGTQFSGDVSNPATYWNQVPNTVDSALAYIPETSWNETGANGLNASGGGQSTLLNGSALEFPLPSWQSGLIAGATGRMIPDIAFTAAGHDGYMGCSGAYGGTKYGQMCSNGWYSSGGTSGTVFYSFLGTSLATPSFAGMLGVMVQSLGPLGNINPKLYQLAANAQSYQTIFHDITTGNNNVPCRAGTNGCVNGAMGYPVATGYDMVTGLGSIDGDALFLALGGSNLKGTSTAAYVSPALLRPGDTVTLTAQVSRLLDINNGAITGSMTFQMGNTSLGTVAVSDGYATLSNLLVSAANGFSNGTDTITARYSGDSTYAPSNGSVTLSVSATPFASATTLSVSPNPVRLGYTIGISASVSAVTSGEIPTGSVTYQVGGTTVGTVTISNGWTPPLNSVLVSTDNGFSNGTDTITATYSGDSNFSPSSSTATVTVSAARFATTIIANNADQGYSLEPVAEGSAVSLSARVRGDNPGTPTGTLTFATGTATLGTVTLAPDGMNSSAKIDNVLATAANGLGNGTDTVTITYPGDDNFLPSSTSFTLTVYDTLFPLLISLVGDGQEQQAGADSGFQLMLSGGNFRPDSVVLWNGALQPTTTYSDSTYILASISPANVVQEGTYLITVANPAPNAGTSAAQPIAVQLWPLVAKISGVSIALAADGSGNHVVTLTGTDFSTTPVVQWNGTNLPTSYIGPWQITATITAAEYTSRPATVMVVNQGSIPTTSTSFVLQ